MEEAMELSREKDSNERMAGMEHLHQLLEATRKSLSSSETSRWPLASIEAENGDEECREANKC